MSVSVGVWLALIFYLDLCMTNCNPQQQIHMYPGSSLTSLEQFLRPERLSSWLLSSHCCCLAAQSFRLWDSMDCCMPVFPVLHHLPELAQTQLSQWCHPTISSSVIPFSSCLQSFPASGSFLMTWLFASGGQSTGASAQHQSFQWIFRTDFL